jgi:hypothetical protein
MKANMINEMKLSLKDYYKNYIKLRESKDISITSSSSQVNIKKNKNI